MSAVMYSIICIAQHDSKKFTYDESTKNYINYEQLEELTSKFLLNDKSIISDEAIRNQIYMDRSTLPSYTDEEIHKKILAIPTTIPMKYQPEVGQLIRYFLFERREYMTKMLTLSKTYFPVFEDVLDEKDLPTELKYLSIVESALNPAARSRCGATGLWQFMHGTAKHEGMEINTLVDERSDIHKSTEHAAIYLKKLYNIYGDWLLALAAYNSGPGNVNKAIKNSGGYDFWTIKHRLPKETQNYVPSFIAIVYAMHYAKDYKLSPGKPAINIQNCSSETLFEKQSLKYIAELVGTSEEYLKSYNPALKKSIVPKRDNGYAVNIPKEYVLAFQSKKHLLNLDPYIYNPAFTQPQTTDETLLASESNSGSEMSFQKASYTERVVVSDAPEAKASLTEIASTMSKKDPRTYASSPASSSQYSNTNSTAPNSNTSSSLSDYKIVKVTEYEKKTSYHTVKRGENLTQIADENNVSLHDLQDWNNLDRNDNLFVGKKLKIMKNEKTVKPQYVINNSSPTTSTVNTASEANDKIVIHKIKKGETLLQLTRQYGCTLADLKEWNSIKQEDVKVGQEIYIYVEEQAAKFNSYSYYEAKSGDTLQIASARFNIPVELLKQLNNKESDEPLRKGEKIKIPTL
jgi:membrane-bound lytic murein transglycosylase D